LVAAEAVHHLGKDHAELGTHRIGDQFPDAGPEQGGSRNGPVRIAVDDALALLLGMAPTQAQLVSIEASRRLSEE
jgi:hypothetical protein